MKFEWDAVKNIKNYEKHRIQFNQIIDLFTDNNRLERFDYNHSSLFETRYNAIGMSHNKVIFVFFKYKNNETIRIISARIATKNEENLYYEKCYFN